MARRTGALILLLAGIALVPFAESSFAITSSDSRAVLVIDIGDGSPRVHRMSFAGELSGLALLQEAGYDPVTRSFGGLGVAVCALNLDGQIRGCPADSTCLSCANPSYWSYARDPDSTGAFRPSRLGPSSTIVSDGAVEAWRWGTGDPPAYLSFESQFPAPPTTTVAVPPSTAAAASGPETSLPSPGGPATSIPEPGATSTQGSRGEAKSGAPDGTSGSRTPPGRDVTASSASTALMPGADDARSDAGRERPVADGPPVVPVGASGGRGLAMFAILVFSLVVLINLARRSRLRSWPENGRFPTLGKTIALARRSDARRNQRARTPR